MLLVDVMTLFNKSNGIEKQKHNKIIKKNKISSSFCILYGAELNGYWIWYMIKVEFLLVYKIITY